MYVWELVSCRLRGEGWDVWHSTDFRGTGDDGPTYRVHLGRGGHSWVVDGPTLTETYAAAARLVRESTGPAPHSPQAAAPPHFSRATMVTRG